MICLAVLTQYRRVTDNILRHGIRAVRASRDKQEAQMLQRNRSKLRAIEYFAKLLKVTQDHLK